MHLRRAVAAPLVLLAALPLALLAAPARADEGVYRDLLRQGITLLQEAERWHQGGNERRARETALRARRLVEQAESVRAGTAEAAFLGIQASVFAGDLPGARAWLARYASRSPYGEKDGNLHYARAMVALYLEARPDRAITALDRMQKVAPRLSSRPRDLLLYAALLQEADRLARLNQADGAIRLFQRAVRLARRMGDKRKELAARANAGITYQTFGRYEESEDVFRRLLAEDPESPLWHWYLGQNAGKQARFEQAVPYYRRVVDDLEAGKVPPVHRAMLAEAWLRLGNALRNQAGGESDLAKRRALLAEARTSLERFVAAAPRRAPGRYWLGVLLYEEYRLPYEAMVHLKEAHRLDPVCDGALRLLVQIASRHGPPPTDDPEDMADARQAWNGQRAAWQKDLEENAEARRKEREARTKRRPDGADGCM